MTDIEPRLSDVSGTTNEAVSDEDNIGTTVYTIEVECDVNKDDFMTRYYYVANKLRKAISYFERNNCGEFYAFDPVLIAEDVDPLVLDELPTLVAGFHVKSMVRNRCLYVISLSNGLAHGTGVIELGRQVSNWSQSRFAVATDASMKFGNEQHGRAPDVLVQVHATNLAAGVQRCRLFIIELEVGNRSVPTMRADFAHYFEDDSVYSVVGIKLFPDSGAGGAPCQRALAVQWTRNPIGGIISEHVKDFGLLPISPGARRSFSRVMQNSLVGVAAQRWAANRHTPVLHADLAAPPPIHYTHAFVLAAAQFVTGLYGPTAGAILYAGVPPTITFDSARISTFVHNLPPGVPAVEDLVLDLGRLFFEVQRIAALVVPVPPVAAI